MNHKRATRVLGIFITTLLSIVFLLPAFPAKAEITSNLVVGSRGTEVIQLQSFLIAQKFLVADAPTDFFGPLTVAAVRKLQTANKIEAVGFVGPRTRALINNF